MLRISKRVLHLISFDMQSICYISDGSQNKIKQHFSNTNKIKKLMKEYKAVFGTLIETNSQKKKRIKLEKKGRIPKEISNKVNAELQWMIANHGNSLKKITISVKQQNEDTIECLPEIASETESKRTDIDSHNHKYTDSFVNSSKTHINTTKASKKFIKIIKPVDQNANAIDNDSHNRIIPTIESANFNRNTAEINNLRNDTSSSNSSKFDMVDTTMKYNLTLEKLPHIIIQNIPSFPIMSNKREPLEESTEILSISGRNDMETIRFPSVSRILTQTMSPESKLALEVWKSRMIEKLGKEGFDIHQKALLDDGASLHSCIAQRFLGKEYHIPLKIEPVYKSMEDILEDVHYVKAVETYVAHPKLHYKGIVDCVASYRGDYYVIEWKRSDKKKPTLRDTYDAPLQIAAYIGAINSSNIYPFMIKRGLLVIGHTCGTPASVHQLCDNTLHYYWTAWLRRLQAYHIETENDDGNKSTGQ